MIRLTQAFVDMLRRRPKTEAVRRAEAAEAEWTDALAESDSDGVFGILDPIPEQRQWPVRRVKEEPKP